MLEEFKTKGYISIENALTEEQFSKISSIAEFYISRAQNRIGEAGNVSYKLFRTDDLSRDFLATDLLNIEIVYNNLLQILGAGFILQEIFIHFSNPGNTIQELHYDVDQLFRDEQTLTPTYLVGVHYPLCDFTVNNGATRIVAGTQYSFDEPTRIENEKAENIESNTIKINKKGAFIRDCRAWHGAGSNTSNNIRAMYSLAFARNWYGKPCKVTTDLYFSIQRNMRHIVLTD